MAERRMFSKSIIDSDLFLDMPSSTQNLYFHLGMRADDDGFVNSPQKIMRMVSCSKNDMDMLIFKNFIIPFDTGVCVIKHWRIHNYIRNDRYTPTIYTEERSMLSLDDSKSYSTGMTLGIPNDIPVVDVGKVRLGKVSVGEESIDEDEGNNINNLIESDEKIIFAHWNSKGIMKHRELTAAMKSKIHARLSNLTTDEIKEAIDNYKTVISDSELYWYSHKFTLADFMNPKNLDRFLTENDPLNNHKRKINNTIPFRGGNENAKHGTGHAGRTDAELDAMSF